MAKIYNVFKIRRKNMKQKKKEYLISMIKKYQEEKQGGVRILETGIGFYPHGGFTKVCKDLMRSQDTLDTVDIYPEHIKEYINHSGEQDNIKIHNSDSVDFIKNTSFKYDLVYLDSVNCKNHIFNEFIEVMDKLNDKALVVVDDSGIKSHNQHKWDSYKGLKVYEYLIEKQIPFDIPCWNVLSAAF